MNIAEKRSLALKFLAMKNIRRRNYEPLLFRFLWRAGINLRPSHFANFFTNVILFSILFGSAWGAIMWMFSWRNEIGISISNAFMYSGIYGLLMGLTFASFYTYDRRRFAIPTWSELDLGETAVSAFLIKPGDASIGNHESMLDR